MSQVPGRHNRAVRFAFPRSFDLAERSAPAPDDADTQLMMRIIEDLYLENRSLIPEGYDRALDYLGELAPLEVFRFPSGYQAFTWTVPAKWTVNEAWIKHNGRRSATRQTTLST